MFDAISYLVLAGLRSLVGDALTFYRVNARCTPSGHFSIASALHHLLCQPNDVVNFLWVAAAGVTDSRRVAYRRYSDATGGALAGMYFYRHDSGHGLLAGESVVPPTRYALFGLYRRDVAVYRQYRLAALPPPFPGDNAIAAACYFAGHS